MNRKTFMIVGSILVVLAVTPFVFWPVYRYFSTKAVRAALYERTKALVEKNPQLKPEWDRAMEDGTLTLAEAKAIVEKAGEKVGPEDE